MPLFFDTHCHLNATDFAADLDAGLERARAAGVERMVVVGYDLETSKRAVDLAELHPELRATVGIHPHDAAQATPSVRSTIEALADHPLVCAIGETGLDFFRNLSPRDAQYDAFRWQIDLARRKDLPLVVHCRDAYPEMRALLEATDVRSAVFHCYSGDLEFAKFAVARGLMISFTGSLTYVEKKGPTHELVRVATEVPLEDIMIETDCPWLPPPPHRGKRNEPALLPLVAACLARVRGTTEAVVGKTTYENAIRFFRWTR